MLHIYPVFQFYDLLEEKHRSFKRETSFHLSSLNSCKYRVKVDQIFSGFNADLKLLNICLDQINKTKLK